jgi:hypothetical protein
MKNILPTRADPSQPPAGSDDKDHSIGWAKGTVDGNRPYWAELWAEDGITMITIYLSSDGLEFGERKPMQDTFPGNQVVVGDEKVAKNFLEKEGLFKFEEKHFITPCIYTDENGEFWSINIVVGNENEVYCDSQFTFSPYGKNGWGIKREQISEFLKGIEADPAQLSNFIKALSFPVGHVMGQTDFVSWDEMKRNSFDENTLGQIAEQTREWRGDRTPDTPMYWAYEFVAISLESAATNDPVAAECEKLIDGLIKKSIQDFPIPNRKPPTDDTSQRSIPEKKTPISKGSLLDTGLNGDDPYAEHVVTIVKGLKAVAAMEGASTQLKDNWSIIINWSEMDAGEKSGQTQLHIIERAYKAYLAIGIAPSVKLAPLFEEASKHYKAAGYDLKPDKPPAEILQAFGRLLASEMEIDEKRTHDEGQSLQTPSSKQPTKNIISWKRKALIVWGVLSFLFILFAANNVGWYDLTHSQDVIFQLFIIIIGLFFVVYLIGWMVNRFLPNQFTLYTKKTIATALIWVLAVGTWAHFFGEDFFYGDGEEYFMEQFIFFPPVVIIIVAILWRWATRTPNEKEG